jgi:U3 small nucleolar RNA-associated protein 18
MNGTSRSLSFSPDSAYLATSGGDAEVYLWDMRSSRCVRKWGNEGGMPTCGLALSRAQMAVASESGVVNLYSTGGAMPGAQGGQGGGVRIGVRRMTRDGASSCAGLENPTPTRSLMNLTTSAESVQYNHDGQLLAIASRWNKNAVRLVLPPFRARVAGLAT